MSWKDEPTADGHEELQMLSEGNFTNAEVNHGNQGSKKEKPVQELQEYGFTGEEKVQTSQLDEKKIFDNQQKFLDDLDLSGYYPEKITLEMVMSRSSVKLDSLSDIPWSVLSKILMLDYRGRDNVVPLDMKNARKAETNAILFSNDDLNDSFSQLFDTFESEICAPHPSDVIVASLRCCTNTLRQVLCEKMFTCKLSIPLLLPPFLRREPMLLLWSWRGIHLECISPEGQHHSVSAVNHSLPVVSFARIGEISRSKSKFLNEMVNNQSHFTFFNRECENGRSMRNVSEGVVEMAWQLNAVKPDGSEKHDSNKLILNLRGNGNDHRHTMSFLFMISDVVVLMINANETDNILSIFKAAKPCDVQYIFMITKQPNFHFTKDDMGKMKSLLEALRLMGFNIIGMVLDFDNRGEKNIKALKEEVEQKLDRCMKSHTRAPTDRFEAVAKALDFTIDSDISSCGSGEKVASDIMQIMKKNPHSSKSAHLPLQCRPWKRWASLNKEEHRGEKRGNNGLDQYISKIYSEKNEMRRKQINLLGKPTEMFKCFLHHLVNSKHEKRLYFLKWLKIYLDDNSREILPSLQRDCNTKWEEFHHYEEQKDNLGILAGMKYNSLQHELQQFELRLEESSLGLEHFMREIAQAYEAVLSVKNAPESLKKKVGCLPKLMAELILAGYPLEIMDGDAAHVPLKWVEAVLIKLNDIVKEKKIFVLSVLGIQSSGKSTLLNTMFGLKFNVAAGRCTRGVYAQLVPVPKKYHSSKYDYIMVLDTEGLRAPELGDKKIQHDNEIATLVIGLGDVTLVNIKGENVSEIEDVLQIVIHALLKIKLVNKHIALQPSCFFIHQNVPAVDAAQQLKSGQRKFIETLDKVTKAAGKQEDAPQFTKFSQLIDFDINQNVSYFSDLWKGNPPAAPANPGYSENVREVKERLLGDIMHNRNVYLDIPKLSRKIIDLWNGILDQNFVFSFKNNLEIETYISLESKLSDLQWVLKTTALKWFSAKTIVIGNCEAVKNHMYTDLVSELCCHLKEKHEEEKRNLERYFGRDEDNVMLQQWRSRSFQKLDCCYDDIIHRTKKDIERELEKKKVYSDSKKDLEKYKSMITNEAKQLAEDLRKKECEILDDASVRKYFGQKWNSWMDNICKTNKYDDIGSSVKKILIEKFHYDNPLLKRILESFHITSEEVIRKELCFAIDKYVENSWMKSLWNLTWGYEKKKVKDLVANMQEVIRDIVNKTQGQPFQEGDIKALMECGKQTVEKTKKLSIRILNVNEFSIYIVICSYEIACQVHYEMFEVTNFDMQMNQTTDFSNHSCFEKMLKKQFPSHSLPLIEQLRSKMQKKMRYTAVTKNDLLATDEVNKDALLPHAQKVLENFYGELESFLQKPEIQNFKEEYVEEIIRMTRNISNSGNVRFTKTFTIQLAVRACYKALPIFYAKHKQYIDNLNPRKVLERDYFDTFFEMFRNMYHKIAGEEALSKILTERLRKAIENAVDRDMVTDLADDVRNNVPQVKLKKALLQAILQRLLEVDQFEDFFLYLSDISSCYQKWISYFIDNYLFYKQGGSSKYTEIASLKISSLISRVREDIVKTKVVISKDQPSQDALVLWIKTFHEKVTETLPISLSDILSLIDGHEVLTLDSFIRLLEQNIKKSNEKLCTVFAEHTSDHLKTAHNPTVYEIIAKECKGCTERCPFCSAPCTLNSESHLENDIKHMAYEHHPQACGGWRHLGNQKLCTENCTVDVASDREFQCQKTDWKFHPCKKYHEIFPDWKIHGDPSVEAFPYWKWFLVKYEAQLAERYHAKRPDIPESWRSITKEMAVESLGS